MGYDRGDSFSFDFKPNGIPFSSKNRKENCHHDHIPFNMKGNGNMVFSVRCPGYEKRLHRSRCAGGEGGELLFDGNEIKMARNLGNSRNSLR